MRVDSLGIKLALPAAVLAVACAGLARAADTSTPAVPRESFRPRSNIAPTAINHQARGFVALLRYRVLRDNRPSTSRIN